MSAKEDEYEVRCCCRGGLLGYLPKMRHGGTMVIAMPEPFENWIAAWRRSEGTTMPKYETVTIKTQVWTPMTPQYISNMAGRPWQRDPTPTEDHILLQAWPESRLAWKGERIPLSVLQRLPGWRDADPGELALDPSRGWIPLAARRIMDRLEAGDPPHPAHTPPAGSPGGPPRAFWTFLG